MIKKIKQALVLSLQSTTRSATITYISNIKGAKKTNNFCGVEILHASCSKQIFSELLALSPPITCELYININQTSSHKYLKSEVTKVKNPKPAKIIIS